MSTTRSPGDRVRWSGHVGVLQEARSWDDGEPMMCSDDHDGSGHGRLWSIRFEDGPLAGRVKPYCCEHEISEVEA